jgi:hypothetical protein
MILHQLHNPLNCGVTFYFFVKLGKKGGLFNIDTYA